MPFSINSIFVNKCMKKLFTEKLFTGDNKSDDKITGNDEFKMYCNMELTNQPTRHLSKC